MVKGNGAMPVLRLADSYNDGDAVDHGNEYSD